MLEDYPKEIMIKDGTTLALRPVVAQDEEALNKFFFEIPEEERWYRRQKLTDPEVLHKWIETLDYKRIIPLVAVNQDTGYIVANLTLLFSSSVSLQHVAHLRLMVHPWYRHQKLGGLMILECAELAMSLGIERLMAEFVIGIEESAIVAAQKLDFYQAAVLKDYVKDPEGKYRDLLIMVKNLHAEWGDF
ncbi:MAG: N-acetyltransferase family protein [Desulfomonilaceae bacterium]